ncbi:MAG: hypothetical protein ACLFTA_03180 [Candidatus Nanohaloarchaea archaeon]
MPISQRVKSIHTLKTVEGWNLVKTDTAAAFPALIKYLASNHDKILWIDSSNQASTHFLESRPQALEKLYIARAFTALQHHQLCRNTEGFDLLILPEIDRLYTEDSMRRKEAVELFEDAVEGLEGKILYSVSGEIEDWEKNENVIEVEQTGQGLKFSQKDRQTRAYSDRTGVQTTVPLYREVKTQWEEPIKPTETGWRN